MNSHAANITRDPIELEEGVYSSLFNPRCACGAHLIGADTVPTLPALTDGTGTMTTPGELAQWRSVWRVLLPQQMSSTAPRHLSA